MATLQLMPVTTINGTTYATAQLILTSSTPEKPKTKTILPKQEPSSPPKSDLDLTPPDFLRICQKKSDNAKRRIHFSKKALTHPRPHAVTRRNTRERNRVKAVNQGFVTLANHVPPYLRNKKMSKVDTLKAAIVYIQALQEALGGDTDSELSPYSLCQELMAASTVDSSGSSDSCNSVPSSPEYQQAPEFVCHPSPDASSSSSPYPYQQFNAYHHTQPQPCYTALGHNTDPMKSDGYQPQSMQYNFGPGSSTFTPPSFANIDFTRSPSSVNSCPSPTSSYSAESDQMEAEILEFASWFQ